MLTDAEAEPHVAPGSPGSHLDRDRAGRPFRLLARRGPLILVGTCAILFWLGWYAMFTSVEFFDDEGDWLIALKTFREHGSLYHYTWSQAGPFYYDFWTAVFSALRLPFTIDTSRLAALVTWIAIVFLAGFLVWTESRRVTLTVLAEVCVFLVMEPLAGEPMEPAGLATLLLMGALLSAIVLRRRRPVLGMVLAGAMSTAAVLSKVNIGVFLVAGIVAAALVSAPARRPAWVRPLLAAVIVVALPFVLCSSVLGEQWVRFYVFVVAASGAAAVCTAARAGPRTVAGGQDFTRADALYAAAGAAATGGLVVVTALATGTSVAELVNGAFLAQRNLASTFTGPATIHMGALSLTALVTLIALARAALPPDSRPPLAIRVGGRAVAGTWIIVTAVGGLVVPAGMWGHVGWIEVFSGLFQPHPVSLHPLAGGSFQYGAPLAWVALRPPDGFRPGPARATLVLVGVLLTLEGFPVAGHQMSWGVVVLVLVGVMVLSDALVLAGTMSAVPSLLTSSRIAMAGLLLLVAGTDLWTYATDYTALYSQNRSPGLAGTGLVRWPRSVDEAFSAVSATLEADCATFYGLPGLNSFYFFTGEQPPTGLLTTQWMYLMSRQDQAAVVARLSRARKVCLIYYQAALAFWERDKPLPSDSPLLSYFEENFVPVADVDGYVVLERSPAPRRNAGSPGSGTPSPYPDFNGTVPPSPSVIPPLYS